MKNPVLIFGASHLGRAAKELFEGNKVVVYGFLDDNPKLHGVEIDEVTVLGSMDDDGLLKLIGKKCEAFVAIDDNRVRKNIVKMLTDRRHVQPVNGIHEKSLISPRAELGHGNFIDGLVVVNAGAKVGSHCIVHSMSTIGVGSRLGDFVQIGAGCTIGSEVVIEEDAFIGSGTVIVAGLTVGKGARVGAGSVVIAPVAAGETVFGNPAQKVKT
jgi:sugar O-acyltransferase (sialic acid O-acetyltransferase NeuD family)